MSFKEVLIVALSAAAIGTPIAAGNASSSSAPLGVVLAADNAGAGAGVIASGETVYDGDRLRTQPKSTLRVRLGSGQILLRQDTSVDVHSFPNGFSANLNNGTIVVSSPEGQTFQLIADGATVRPAHAEPTSGQISMISPTELLLTGTRGTLEVSMGDEVQTVEAGSSYMLDVETEDSTADPAAQRPQSTGRNRFKWRAIPVIATGAGIIVWRALVSPTAPGH